MQLIKQTFKSISKPEINLSLGAREAVRMKSGRPPNAVQLVDGIRQFNIPVHTNSALAATIENDLSCDNNGPQAEEGQVV
jgi:hypothetical protein